MKTTVVLLLSALLAGCATEPPRTAADDPTFACLRGLQEQQKYQHLYTKIAKSAEAATLEQLASKEVATEEEKVMLSSWAQDRRICHQEGQGYRAAYAPPGYVTVFDNLQMGLISLTARLYAGEITFGQFNQARINLAAETDRGMDRVRQEQMQALDRQAQINLIGQQQIIESMRRAFVPVPMQPSTSCTSRSIGGTVYTDCR